MVKSSFAGLIGPGAVTTKRLLTLVLLTITILSTYMYMTYFSTLPVVLPSISINAMLTSGFGGKNDVQEIRTQGSHQKYNRTTHLTVSSLRPKKPNTTLSPFSQGATSSRIQTTPLPSTVCQFPLQDPFDPLIMKHFKKYPDIDCSGRIPNLVYLEENLLKVNKTKVKLLNMYIDRCNYMTVTLRPGDDSKIFKSQWSKSFTRSITVESHHENFVVQCYFGANVAAKSYISRIVKKNLTEKSCERNYKRHIELNSPKETLSVLLLGIDGTSRQNTIRSMPKTRDFLLNKMKAVELFKFNKVGENTFPNIVPLLAGISEQGLENKGWSRSLPFDKFDDLFLWNDYKQAGYRTGMMVDHSFVSAFHYQKKGWHNPQFDYYHRPMILIKENDDCVGDRAEVPALLDYWVQLATLFNNTKTKPYFVFSFSQEITHDNPNKATQADQLYFDFFQNLVERRVLNNTVVVFFSDHGARFGPIRATKPGTYECYTPFVFFMFPPWFHTKYPSLISTFRTNQHRLTSHFDLHATLKDLLYFKGETGKGSLNTRGISLFKEIPVGRKCRHAGIPKDFCMCLQQLGSSVVSPILLNRMALAVVKRTTDKILNHKHLCVVFKYIKTKHVLPIQPESQCKTCLYFRVAVEVSPGSRDFEALVEYNKNTEEIKSIGDPILLTMYGKQADCVKDAKLKPYCYCK